MPRCSPCRRRRAAQARRPTLLVYTALETDQLKAYKEGFDKAYPDIEIKWVRDSTGVITAKLLAEKGQSAGRRRDGRGRVQPGAARQERHARAVRAAQGFDALMPQYRDTKNPPAWVGMDVWGATICFNTVEAQKKNIPKPETWKDLTKPVYKGQIVMPQPGLVGHRLLRRDRVAAAVGRQRQGRRLEVHGRAAREHRAVHALGLQAVQPWPRAGEFVVGISFEYRANTNKAKGAPIDLVFPKEGLGWDLEAFGIHKGTKKHRRRARSSPTGPSSKDAMRLYAQELRDRRACPASPQPLANVPGGLRERAW